MNPEIDTSVPRLFQVSNKLSGICCFKMKIKTISRSKQDYTRERVSGVEKLQKNKDPRLHPFEQAREYTRAVRAVKLDKMFAKPFIAAMDDHSDGVWCTATSPTRVTQFVSGSCDGEIRVWDLALRRTVWASYAHTGFVRGLTVDRTGQWLFSCGDDRTIKQFRFDPERGYGRHDLHSSGGGGDGKQSNTLTLTGRDQAPVETWMSKSGGCADIDHCWIGQPSFATCSTVVDVWDYHRSEPIHSFEWGCDSINTVAFNPAQSNLLASTASDRSIILHDTRTATPVHKVTLYLKTNALAWNPQEPMNFAIANEDHNAYTFDMRNLSKARVVHKDHVGAVMDVSFSPTGRELATASYDRTVRIFDSQSGKSKQCYHSKRMQRVFTVDYTADSQFILSGSDDANVRIWKANASKQLGRSKPRQHRKQNYMDQLKARFKHTKEVKSISTHLHVPKLIKKMQSAKRDERGRENSKRKRREDHNKEGVIEKKKERKRMVLKEEE